MNAPVLHDFHWDRPVQVNFGKENPGFLLARAGTIQAPEYYAHYEDGAVERIDPPAGFPRPDPDPAVRSKRVALPPSLQSFDATGHKHASRHTGQLRRVVQCLYSRGLESKFAWRWAKTHGILEYPDPRQVGASVADEAIAYARRRFWLLEVSAAGVYAAPIDFGLDALKAARNLADYLPTPAQLAANPSWEQYAAEVSLAWAYANRNDAGRVARLVDAEGMAAVYGYGVWYPGMGWAFSASGAKAANVVYREASVPAPHYETRVARIAFSVAFASRAAEITNLGNGRARVALWAHGFSAGMLAAVSGAAQDAYNGAHVVLDPTEGAFEFALAGNPPSPATGDVRVANAAAEATLSADVSLDAAGRVTFKAGPLGTLWVPKEDELSQWQAIRPFYLGGSATLACDGAVHVFHDGEDEVLTRWSAFYSTRPASKALSPHPPPGILPAGANPDDYWNYQTSWQLAQWDDPAWTYVGPLCQLGGAGESWYVGHPCSYRYHEVIFAEGHFDEACPAVQQGFNGPFDAVRDNYLQSRHTAKSQADAAPFLVMARAQYGNANGATCGSCGGGRWSGLVGSAPYWRNCSNTKVNWNEQLTGGSSLVLLAEEREAVFCVGWQRTQLSGASVRINVQISAGRREWSAGAAPFTDYDVFGHGPGSETGRVTTAIASDTGIVYDLNLRASGGVGVFVAGASLTSDLGGFTSWASQTHEEVQSGLFFMRGGLAHPEPSLVPADQRGNYILRFESTELRGGRFAALTGKVPAAFIGRV